MTSTTNCQFIVFGPNQKNDYSILLKKKRDQRFPALLEVTTQDVEIENDKALLLLQNLLACNFEASSLFLKLDQRTFFLNLEREYEFKSDDFFWCDLERLDGLGGNCGQIMCSFLARFWRGTPSYDSRLSFITLPKKTFLLKMVKATPFLAALLTLGMLAIRPVFPCIQAMI